MKTDLPGNQPARFERTLLPEVETLVTIKTIPNAVCHLRHESDEAHKLQLDADERGIVRFHARPRSDAQPIELTLDCTDTHGSHLRHTVALRPGTPASTSDRAEVAAAPPGELREPLTGDPMALSNHELVARRYPPRPDPARYPARYARWLRQVSQPFTHGFRPTTIFTVGRQLLHR
jgi:hypothetical protein